MSYRLHDGLTYCQVGERLVFLDVENDRYFQLPCTLEQAFTARANGDATVDVSSLVALNVLVEQPGTSDAIQPCIMTSALRSVMESSIRPSGITASAIPEVHAIVYATKFQLRTRCLKSIVRSLQATQHNETTGTALHGRSQDEQQYHQATTTFLRARRYVPAETHCLLDSMSLLRFLSRRALGARLVFGVIPDPFSAHCWVQVGNLVLNDTVGNVNAHTPIRVV